MKPTPCAIRDLVRGTCGADGGATSLEWALLLGFVGLPAALILDLALDLLAAPYEFVATLNSLPFP